MKEPKDGETDAQTPVKNNFSEKDRITSIGQNLILPGGPILLVVLVWVIGLSTPLSEILESTTAQRKIWGS